MRKNWAQRKQGRSEREGRGEEEGGVVLHGGFDDKESVLRKGIPFSETGPSARSFSSNWIECQKRKKRLGKRWILPSDSSISSSRISSSSSYPDKVGKIINEGSLGIGFKWIEEKYNTLALKKTKLEKNRKNTTKQVAGECTRRV